MHSIPRHIAIIMDGNGRWAQAKGLSRTAGHREGVKRAQEIIMAAKESGVGVLTLFAFSSENWQRPIKEINILMRLFSVFLKKNIKKLQKNNIRLKVIGRMKPLPDFVLSGIREAEAKTRQNADFVLVIALNYGSRQEIIDAVKKITKAVIAENENINDLDEAVFSKYLYTAGLPDPDILIRTSGEIRLSNFLLWQLSYTEFYFTDKYWPDFTSKDLLGILAEFKKRQRRFGGVKTDFINKVNLKAETNV